MIAFTERMGTGSVHMRLGIAGEFKKHDKWALWASADYSERATPIDRAGGGPANTGDVVKNGFRFNHAIHVTQVLRVFASGAGV